MKKNNLLLALLASSLILTSCGKDEPTTESGKENETSQSGDSNGASVEPGQTTEPEISVDTRTDEQKVKDLFALMAEGKTSTIEYNGYTTEFYGDNKGIWYEVPASDTESQSYGIAIVPNFGIYNVLADDDTGICYFAGIMTPNKALKLSDIQYTTMDLGKAAKSITFAESSRTHTFSTDEATFCDALLGALGGGSLASYYTTKKASFNVNEDGTALTNMSLELKGSTDTSKYKNTTVEGIKISKIGKTINLDFELLITNPDITPRTAWTTYESQYLSKLYTGFTLPFPTGASYAVNVTALENGSFYFEDLGCGNLVDSYKSQLTAAGFTQNDEVSNTQTGVYCYEKTLAAATANAGAIKEYVKFTWENDATQAIYYPNGKFTITAYPIQEALKITTSELATMLSSHTLGNGTAYWPNMSFDNCTGVAVEDLTEDAYDYFYSYYGYEMEYYAYINLYYATEAEAIAAVNYINTQLSNNGYTLNSSRNGYILSTYDPYTYDQETVQARATVAYDDDGNYLGYVEVFICHYTEESWYY